MGIFRQIKDMRDMANAAPDLIEQAQQAGAQARQLAEAQRAAMQAQMGRYTGMPAGAAPYGQPAPFGQPGTAPSAAGFEPIDGVTLDQFAAVSKASAGYNYDASRLPEIAASMGIPAYSWENAAQGWNVRLRANPAVAQRFSQLYRGI